MKIKEELKALREKSVKALLSELAAEKANLIKAKIKMSQEKKPAPHKIRNIKKKIARINTIIFQKMAQEIEENEQKQQKQK